MLFCFQILSKESLDFSMEAKIPRPVRTQCSREGSWNVQKFVDQNFRLLLKRELVESLGDHLDDVVRFDGKRNLQDRRERPDASASLGFAAMRAYRPDETGIHVRHIDPS